MILSKIKEGRCYCIGALMALRAWRIKDPELFSEFKGWGQVR